VSRPEIFFLEPYNPGTELVVSHNRKLRAAGLIGRPSKSDNTGVARKRGVPMRFRPCALASIIALAACASPHQLWWTKSGFSQKQFDRDDYECQRDAKQTYLGKPIAANDPQVMLLSRVLGVKHPAEEMYMTCMRAHGYTQTNGPRAVSTGPESCPPGTEWLPPTGSYAGACRGISRTDSAPDTARTPTPTEPASSVVVQSGTLNATYTGTISGVQAGQQFSMRITFTIVRTGEEIAGVWTTSAGTSGTVKARVDGERLLDFRAKQLNPCDGEFIGGAVMEGAGAQLRGSYTGTGCGVAVDALFVVGRQ
jgi:hypothetical protein